MATTPPFKYQPMFEKGKDTTEYYLLTKDYVSVSEFEGKPILKIEKEGLTAMANAAFRDVSFMLRRSHNEQVAKILSDPEASDNDKYVALTFLRNAEVASKGVLPFCQDTGTAIIHGEKGQQVWTGYCDEEALSLGVYKTYTEENLRYSQNAPLTMYDEVNTKCNLPAQIDIEATEGMEYEFLCVTKGGGSANKTYLYQETKAILNPETLVPFLISKIKTLGTAACPPYHIALVIGGTSAEKNLLTVKLASTHFYDNLPTTGNEFGRAFRDVELEKLVLKEAHKIGLGAQFGGKYLAHDIRIIRLPRHGASCPVGLGVSCSADRNIKCKINKEGIWIEKLDSNPGELIPAELRKAGEGDVVDHAGMADRRGMRATGDQPGDVGDVGGQHRTDLLRDGGEAGEVDGAGHGGAAAEDQLRALLQRQVTHLVEVDPTGLLAHAVVHGVEPLTGRRHAPAVREVATTRQPHPQDGLTGLEHREVDREVGRGARVRLHVGVLDAEQRLRPGDRELLERVDELLALVVALAGVALRAPRRVAAGTA